MAETSEFELSIPVIYKEKLERGPAMISVLLDFQCLWSGNVVRTGESHVDRNQHQIARIAAPTEA
jgi:hypothetical protein